MNTSYPVERTDSPSLPRRAMSISTGLIFVAALLGQAGCGQSGPALGEVEGTVKLNGKPLPKASVVFQPADGRTSPSTGTTDDQGRYVLQYSRGRTGATIGPHRIKITTYRLEDVKDRSTVFKEQIPAKYNVETELQRDVVAGKQTFDFELDGKGKIVQPPEV